MSQQSWPQQKALPHKTGLDVQRLAHTIECGSMLCHDREGYVRTMTAL